MLMSAFTRHFSPPSLFLFLPGISFKTQVLYLAVFVTRYLDVLFHFVSVYNTFMKIFFITTASVVVWAMLGPLKDSRSKSLDTFRWEFIIAPSALLALIFHDRFTLTEVGREKEERWVGYDRVKGSYIPFSFSILLTLFLGGGGKQHRFSGLSLSSLRP